MSLSTIYIEMTSKCKIVSLPVLASMLSALSLPAQTAFAATQTVAISGPWRTATSDEATKSNFVSNELVPADANTNPQDVSETSPGWTPDGATHTENGRIAYSGIVLDIPKIDLSCSSNVTLEVTSDAADKITGAPAGNNAIHFMVFSSVTEPATMNGDFIQYDAPNSAPNVWDLTGSMVLNPNATAFGIKLILTVQKGTQAQSKSWNVHDLSVELSYDDENGSCSGVNAPIIATSCDDSYLSTEGILPDAEAISYFQNEFGMNISEGPTDPDAIKSSTGLTFNPDRDATLDPFDFLNTDEGGVYIVFTSIGGATPFWMSFVSNALAGPTSASAFLPSLDLSDVRIFLIVFKGTTTDQITATVSNARATVKHINDVSVCGINATNSVTTTTTTSPNVNTVTTVPSGAVNGAGVSTLPETGKDDSLLALVAVLFTAFGSSIIAMQKCKHKKLG